MSADAQDDRPAGGDLAGQALRLVDALREAVGSFAEAATVGESAGPSASARRSADDDASGPDEPGAGRAAGAAHASSCGWCPVCRGIDAVRDAGLLPLVADAAGALSTALAALAETARTAEGPPPSGRQEARAPDDADPEERGGPQDGEGPDRGVRIAVGD